MEPGEPPKSRRDSLVWLMAGEPWWLARWRVGNPPTSRRDSLVVLQGRWRADGAWGTVVVMEAQEPTNESS